MNIYDISKLTGVSIATVSRVINGSVKVSEKTRIKVMDAIQRNGYVPNSSTRRKKAGNTVGFLGSSKHAELLPHILNRINSKNIIPGVIMCDGTKDGLEKSLRRFGDMHAGIIIMDGRNLAGNSEIRDGIIKSFADSTPVIMIGAHIDHPDIYCITCPEQDLVCEITLSHIKNGITDMVYLYSSLNYGCTDALDGYRNAFSIGGLADTSACTKLCPEGFNDACNFISEMISKNKAPKLIIASDDELAAGALKAVSAAGIRIPEEMEIIGTGNTMISNNCTPEITSIDCQYDKLCEQAVVILSSLMKGVAAPTLTVLRPITVKKGTTL